MMEPLRDVQAFGSPDEAELARLLRSSARAVPPAVLKRRVYQSLGASRRLGPRVMRIATAAAIPAVAMAIAGAAVAMYWRSGADIKRPLPPPRVAPAVSVPAAPRVSQPAESASPPDSPLPPSSPSAGASAVASSKPSASQTARRPIPGRGAGRVGSEATATPTAAPLESTEARVAAAPPAEAALVLAGLRALRREHDPSRASVLLARYLERFPGGVLVQEALAIAIEAGLARGDRPAAIGLAQQYLARFPTGRFAAIARKALDHPLP